MMSKLMDMKLSTLYIMGCFASTLILRQSKELYSSKEFKIYGNLQIFDRIILYSDNKKGREQMNTDCLNYAKKCTENYKKSITEYTKKQQVK